MNKPLIVGLAGGTGCGKGYVTHQLIKELGEAKILVIGLDKYYKDLSSMPLEERREQDVDNPEAFDYKLLIEHLKQLTAGKPVTLPKYDYFYRTRSEDGEVQPKPVIVVEGILALSYPELNNLFDLKVWMEVDSDLRLARRLLRDEKEKRHESLQESIDVYLTSARPNHTIWVTPQKQNANFVLDGNKDGPEESKRLAEEIKLHL